MQLSRIEESSDGEVGTGEGKLTGGIIWLCVGSGPGSPSDHSDKKWKEAWEKEKNGV